MGKRRKSPTPDAAWPSSIGEGKGASQQPPVSTAEKERFLRNEWSQDEVDARPTGSQTASPAAARNLDYYFNSYSSMGIHEEMLKDRVRTSSYYNAIMLNRAAFKDAVVLDIGSGTGVLSIFAARAGAKHVYAIEYSDIYDLSVEVIAANGLTDKITVIRERAEDVVLPIPPNSVDIIVSEWMGYFLLYESMMDCVLMCRDKWLKPGGMVLPDKVKMYIAGIEDGEYKNEKFSFWDNVYGIDYSQIKPVILQEPIIDVMNTEKIISDAALILQIDLREVKIEDLEFCSEFNLTFNRNDYLHGFVVWFDCIFDHGLHKPIVLSTSPYAQYTHWKQTIFYTDIELDPLPVNDNENLRGMIAVKKGSANPRTIDVKINFELQENVKSTRIYHIK